MLCSHIPNCILAGANTGWESAGFGPPKRAPARLSAPVARDEPLQGSPQAGRLVTDPGDRRLRALDSDGRVRVNARRRALTCPERAAFMDIGGCQWTLFELAFTQVRAPIQP